MSIVTLRNVHWDYQAQTVLDGLDWEIQRGEKVGLIGPNGCGKTTLFKLIAGYLQPPIGTVTRQRGLQVAYLPQEPELDSTRTLWEEVSTTFDNMRQLENRLTEVAHQISEHHETDQAEDLMAEYDELQHRLQAAGGYGYETLAKEVLGGMGFSPQQYDLPISALSGGQKCRVALTRLLLQEADLLLLDEPTNHLDIDATLFLEKFLAGYHGGAIIVSHDRYLLDRVVDKIADLEEKRVTLYPCNYSDYAEAKSIRLLNAEREFDKQQDWLKHQQDFIDRNRANAATAKRARGRAKLLQRMNDEGKLVDRPKTTRSKMALNFQPPGRKVADRVFRCDGLSKAYGNNVLFKDLTLEFYRGEKIGLVGPNGVGKTTLLKIAMGQVAADAGQFEFSTNLAVGYYDQEHSHLNPANIVIDEIIPNLTGPQAGEIRSYLARFLFRGNDVYKRVGDLSGGEQSRLALAKLVYSNPQMLLLDEPTNHLDIPSKEALEDALISFEGTILLVSHDRYFLDRVISRLLVLKPGSHELVPGNWSTYQELMAEREETKRAAAPARKSSNRPASRTAQTSASAEKSPYARWSVERLEEAIMELENQLADAEMQFADPAVYRDVDRTRALRTQADQIREQLSALNGEWEGRAE